MPRRAARWKGLLALCAGAFMSCYLPDLTTQIYKCDRGKCPEGFYCIDNVYCTQQVPACSVGGIELGPDVAVCIGAKNPADPKTICASGTTTASCDQMMVSQDLCKGAGASISHCAYCCK